MQHSGCADLVARIDADLSIVATIEAARTGWSMTLSPSAREPTGDRRLQLGIQRICELDFALAHRIRAGRSVQCNIPNKPTLADGPHLAGEQISPLFLPLRISDTLYPYQRQGVAWLLRRRRALLADDMGLGKTAQALAAARRLVRRGAILWALVVAPRTLVANWVAETRRWAPELSVATALPSGATKEERWRRLVRRAHVVLTSYEQLRDPATALLRNVPDLIIADEAHRLRNVDALCTAGFRTLQLRRFWALTGTPLERDAEDMAALFSLLDPSRFAPGDATMARSSLRARVRPYLLRRRKRSVLQQLPSVVETNETLELTTPQRKAYASAIRDHVETDGSVHLLALFNRLRMLCDVEPNTGASAKLDRIVELLWDIERAGEKTVVFSYVLAPLRWLLSRLGESEAQRKCALITGEMTLEERNEALHGFKTLDSCRVLLASTRVASEGLTLTEANHVIFINRWWNPSSNAQARDRVVRIGQRRTVNVWSFTCKGTVEERLDLLLRKKVQAFDELVESLSRSPSRETRSFLLEQ